MSLRCFWLLSWVAEYYLPEALNMWHAVFMLCVLSHSAVPTHAAWDTSAQNWRAAHVGISAFRCTKFSAHIQTQEFNYRKQAFNISPPSFLCMYQISLSLGCNILACLILKITVWVANLCFIKKKSLKGWRDVSAVKHWYWSGRGPKFSSTHVWWLTTVCNYIPCNPTPPSTSQALHTHSHVHT